METGVMKRLEVSEELKEKNAKVRDRVKVGLRELFADDFNTFVVLAMKIDNPDDKKLEPGSTGTLYIDLNGLPHHLIALIAEFLTNEEMMPIAVPAINMAGEVYFAKVIAKQTEGVSYDELKNKEEAAQFVKTATF